MAGPEDSTISCSHHHGNNSPPDTSYLCLQDNEDNLLNKTHNVPLMEHTLKPHTTPNTSAVSDGTTESGTDLLQSEDKLKIDLRHGKAIQARPSAGSQSSETETSQPVCENCNNVSDVFDDSNHPHLFFIEDDDDDDDIDVDSDNDEKEETDEDSAFLDDYTSSNERDGGGNRCVRFLYEDSKTDASAADGEKRKDFTQGNLNLENSFRPDHVHSQASSRPSSPWIGIPDSLRRASSSPLMTVCRHSHCHMVVRCQMVHSYSEVRMTNSCPPAFSPRWTQVMPTVRFRGSGKSLGRKRCNTFASLSRQDPSLSSLQGQQVRQGQGQTGSPGDDPTPPGFIARSRSYSESDVQRLLMREMSMELRRIGDEFNHSRGRRLTTVSETALELDHDHDFDM